MLFEVNVHVRPSFDLAQLCASRSMAFNVRPETVRAAAVEGIMVRKTA
jgi:hypothetical protein